MFCNKCGKKIPDGAKFCIYCGKQVVIVSQKEYDYKKVRDSHTEDMGRNYNGSVFPVRRKELYRPLKMLAEGFDTFNLKYMVDIQDNASAIRLFMDCKNSTYDVFFISASDDTLQLAINNIAHCSQSSMSKCLAVLNDLNGDTPFIKYILSDGIVRGKYDFLSNMSDNDYKFLVPVLMTAILERIDADVTRIMRSIW